MAVDINSVELLDLIDLETLQEIQDAFSAATGMAALATDKNGAVTNGSGFTHFCMNMTRNSKIGAERCNSCDLRGGDEAAKTGRPSVYYCHGGLVDFAAPIIVAGKHIGSLIGGQVLPEPPDLKRFRKIAREIGVDEEEYVKAVKAIKVVPKAQIDGAAKLLYTVANALSSAGFKQLKMMDAQDNMRDSIHMLVTESDRINGVLSTVSDSINQLQTTFLSFNNELTETMTSMKNLDKLVSYIKDISMQLTLLGFNASVEARKSGSHGAGFGAIAQEIRRLSGETSNQTQQIDNMLDTIRRNNNGTQAGFKNTDEMLNSSIQSINELEDISSKILSLVEKLHEIEDEAK